MPQLLVKRKPIRQAAKPRVKSMLGARGRRHPSVSMHGGLVTAKKRGRNLLSSELEDHLLNTIRSEWTSRVGIPDRIWIARQARSFISKHNIVGMKCSKGWLDKFMKRNEHIITQHGNGHN